MGVRSGESLSELDRSSAIAHITAEKGFYPRERSIECPIEEVSALDACTMSLPELSIISQRYIAVLRAPLPPLYSIPAKILPTDGAKRLHRIAFTTPTVAGL